jgi:hypothetical protein
MKICENCSKEHDETYGSGRFCSIKCARGFSTKAKRKEINEAVSKKLTKKIDKGEKIGYIQKSIKPKNIKYCLCGQQLSPRNELGFCNKCKYSSEIYRKNVSNSLKGKTGGYRKGAGQTKGGRYQGFYFDSPFEIEIAKYLDTLDIKWKRNTKRFYFIFNNKKTYYIPDFYINNSFYLEAKGYWHGDKQQKTEEAVRQNNLNWKVIMWKDWKKNNSILLTIFQQ